ncbi:RNA-directed DNA polymerase, eukaryota, reverse transcriptase zinc-binding domain protein, partial [Tanacetum coccineum]
KEVICKKSIAIEYSWIPSRCCHYKVFRHNYESCSKHCERKKGVNSGAGHNDDSVRKNEGMDDDGFRNVGKKSNNEKLAYQPKTTGKYMENRTKKEDEVNERVGKNDQENNDTRGDIEEHELIELEDMREMEKVNMFIRMERKPTEDDMKEWNVNMCNYFKQRWKLLVDKGKDQLNMRCEDDDVITETNGIEKGMEDNEWWKWSSNIRYCDKGCRIILGWNEDTLKVTIVHEAKQSLLCLIKAINGSFRSFCSIVYVANTGDLNVTLKVFEHSFGNSIMSADMHDYNDCVNQIEVEDICSSGLNFTWTKNLQRVKQGDYTSILKKLDRLIINESFMKQWPNAHALFMPYIISDLSPVILYISNGIVAKRKLFKFVKYVVEKDDFLKEDEKEWKKDIDGCQMFKVVKKLRILKKAMKKINWKNGNSFEKPRNKEVDMLKEYVDAVKEEEKLLYQKSKIKWEISSKEVKDALFDIGDNKAPDPDGYTALFFKKAWPVIGNDVVNVVREFFNTGYERKGGLKRVAFKIDIHKAYDTVNWSFLEKILNQFGFHSTMVNWIMKCVSTSAFSISVNNEIHGFFKGGRGLRQGEPISPYLFIVVMEVFNLIMQRNIGRDKNFHYHFGSKKLKITHVCFADDLIMFYHGDTSSMKVVERSIEELTKYSVIVEHLVKDREKNVFWSLNDEDLESLLNLKNMMYHSRRIRYFPRLRQYQDHCLTLKNTPQNPNSNGKGGFSA